MAEMLRQIIPGLERLHAQGYSHGDLKLENICARTSQNGNLKFTLIDFGMSQKIVKRNTKKDIPTKVFRGNLMFASDRQIQIYKPTKVCDLVSLMYVVYFFIENGLPWTDYVDLIMARDRSQNLYNPQIFKQLRL